MPKLKGPALAFQEPYSFPFQPYPILDDLGYFRDLESLGQSHWLVSKSYSWPIPLYSFLE